MSETSEAPWWGARNGARVTSPSGSDVRPDARHPPQRTVESELAKERHAFDRTAFQLAGGDQHGHRDRKVEPHTALAQAGRRKVDGDPPQVPGEAAREHRGPHPV